MKNKYRPTMYIFHIQEKLKNLNRIAICKKLMKEAEKFV